MTHKQLGRKDFIEIRGISGISGWIDHDPTWYLSKAIEMFILMKITAAPFLMGLRSARHGDAL
jgi:hypothetical protein